MQYGYLPTRGEWPTVTTTDFRFIEAGRVGGSGPVPTATRIWPAFQPSSGDKHRASRVEIRSNREEKHELL